MHFTQLQVVETAIDARHILLVDGDQYTRHTFRILFQLNGFTVRKAGDGEEAWMPRRNIVRGPSSRN